MTATDPITLNPALQAIIDAPLPSVRRATLRREPRKVIASEIRSLLKSMGLKGISVTAPNYSRSRSVYIQTPHNEPEPLVVDKGGYTIHHPVYREARNAALKKIEQIILAAFPDLEDRNDSMTDHYDYRLSIS